MEYHEDAGARSGYVRRPMEARAAVPSRSSPVPLWIAAALSLVASLALSGAKTALADPGSSPPSGESDRAREGDRDAGAVAYAGCAVCHGADGLGRSDGTFPRIAGQHASVIVKQVDDIREGRRGNPIMASHVDTLTDPAQIADVAAYVASLSPAAGGSGNGRGEDPERARGEELYRRDCVRCHGAAGAGNASALVPVIAGQHYAYLLRQLRAIAGSLRRNAHPEMVEAVFDYRDDDLRAVATYLAALPWPPSAAAH